VYFFVFKETSVSVIRTQMMSFGKKKIYLALQCDFFRDFTSHNYSDISMNYG